MTNKELKALVKQYVKECTRECLFEVLSQEFVKDVLTESLKALIPIINDSKKVISESPKQKYSLEENIITKNDDDPVRKEVKKNKFVIGEEVRRKLKMDKMPPVMQTIMEDTIKNVEENGFGEEEKSVIDKLEISPEMVSNNMALAGISEDDSPSIISENKREHIVEVVDKDDGSVKNKPVILESIKPMGSIEEAMKRIESGPSDRLTKEEEAALGITNY